MGLFDWLFGKKQPQQELFRFEFLVAEKDETIPANRWYQQSHWKRKNFVKYSGIWDSDWKRADVGEVSVAGISRGQRSSDFICMATEPDFKMFLEDEPDNPVNTSARKVMISATVEGESVTRHIGYLPDEVADRYAGEELDIRPNTAVIPTPGSDKNLGVTAVLLVRSARYLKKQKKGE